MNADGLQDNAQHSKTFSIKTAICAPSIRPDVCTSSRGCRVTCRRVGDIGHETHHQVPLAPCWAITMHKSQGQTMDKAIVDLGKSESTAGLTFAFLNRANAFREAFQTRRQTYLSASATRRRTPSSSRWGDTPPPWRCSGMSVHIYVSLVRRRVVTPAPHYTDTCVNLTIVAHLSFSERLAIANLSNY